MRRVAVWRGGSFLSQPPMKLLVEAGGRSTSGRVRQVPSARPFGIGSRRGRAGQAPSCSLQPRGKPALPSTCAARDKRPGNRGGLEKHRCWSFPRKAAVTSNKRKHSVSPKIQFRSRRRGQRRAESRRRGCAGADPHTAAWAGPAARVSGPDACVRRVMRLPRLQSQSSCSFRSFVSSRPSISSWVPLPLTARPPGRPSALSAPTGPGPGGVTGEISPPRLSLARPSLLCLSHPEAIPSRTGGLLGHEAVPSGSACDWLMLCGAVVRAGAAAVRESVLPAQCVFEESRRDLSNKSILCCEVLPALCFLPSRSPRSPCAAA